MIPRRHFSWSRWVPLVLLFAALAACQPARSGGKAATTPPPSIESHTLTILGYNYTNRYIDQFSVNGAGGSNLQVSTPEEGGGKGTCCAVWVDGTPLPVTMHVQWVADTCVEFLTNKYGERRATARNTYKEQDVLFKGPVPADPNNLEVHFYPDGHIEIAITKMPSKPLLKLDPEREVKAALCPDVKP